MFQVASVPVLEVDPAIAATAPSFRRRAALFFALVVWSLGVAAGSWYGFRYETTETKTTPALDRWPANGLCALSSRCPTLVMFAHPRCPCTRASLNELALLMTHCRDRVEAHVVFFQPNSTAADWARTDLWDSAAGIPGVTPRLDEGGTAQQRFGARVSGEVFLYLPTGELAFHGGITAGRGHAGDNDGRCSLESFLLRQERSVKATPVFGCALVPASLASQTGGAAIQTRSDQ
jgi:hypothetical protein